MAVAKTIVLNIIGNAAGAKAALAEVEAKATEAGNKFKEIGKWGAVGLAGFAADAVKSAADFQELTTQLVTGAGESQDAIGKVRSGLLDMSTQVGVSAADLAKGMFLVESAGFHGAAGLSVMKAAAQGAKVGAADMTTVADGLTTVMNAYNLSGDHATQVTNELVATMKAGKTHLQDLTFSLGRVVPIAAAVGINFTEVGGAMATMTNMGVSAELAAQHLAGTIKSLSNPNKVATDEMTNLGLSANQVSKDLGTKGLAATLNELVDAIKNKMGPAGEVMFQNLAKLTPGTQKYNDALKKLPPEQQTYVAALAKMVGGNRNLDAALQLTGTHAADFAKATGAVADAAKHTKGDVDGWAEASKDFSVKVAQLRAEWDKVVIQVGNKLIPIIQATVGWFQKHATVATLLAAVIGTVLVAAIATYIARMVVANVQLAITGVQTAFAIARTGTYVAALILQSTWTAAVAAAQWLLNAAMSLNPITIVVVAILALVAAFVLAYQHITVFRNAVNTAFTFVKNIVMDVVNWIAAHWPLLLAILTGPFGLAVLFISKHIDSIISFIQSMPGKIRDAAIGVGKAFANGVIWGINQLIRGLDALQLHVHLPGWLGGAGFDWGGFGIPQIPALAQGGIVTSPTLALIGEGGPEAVVPLGSVAAGALGLTRLTIQLDSRVIADVTYPHTRNKLIQFGRGTTNLGLS